MRALRARQGYSFKIHIAKILSTKMKSEECEAALLQNINTNLNY